MKNHTELTLMVRPINKSLILEILNGLATNKKENEEFIIDVGAYIGGIEVDSECIYSLIPKKFFNGEIRETLMVPVRVKTKKEGGYSIPMTTEFYFDIDITTEGLLLPEVSLKDFMGSRYNYNPRIRTNMREFLEDVNCQ